MGFAGRYKVLLYDMRSGRVGHHAPEICFNVSVPYSVCPWCIAQS